MHLAELSAIRLTTDRYEGEGVAIGAIGFIVHAGTHGYVVEFSRSDGTTISLLDLAPGEVEAAPETAVSSAERATA